jgi:hypothetical protein
MECGGFVWITRKDVAYTPDENADKICTKPTNSGEVGTFEIVREAVAGVEGGDGLVIRLQSEDKTFRAFFVYHVTPRKGHRVIEGSPIY